MNPGIPESEVNRILELRFVQGKTYSEIVRLTTVSHSTVARICQGRSRETLRELFLEGLAVA